VKTIACYIRVSKGGKSQAAQEDGIKRWLKKHRINARTVRWYIDKSTRIKLRGPKLKTLQADIHDGKVGTVIVWRIDRLSPIMRDGLNILCGWCDQSLRVVSVDQQIDFKGRISKTISSVLSGVAEMDQEARRERTKAGLAAARKLGRVGGRRPIAADDPRVLKAKKLAAKGKEPSEIAKALDVSPTTAARYVNL
jgi:DNA invertase Pin-like site-specific DNA recombinase